MKKRLIAFISVVTMVFAITGCGERTKEATKDVIESGAKLGAAVVTDAAESAVEIGKEVVKDGVKAGKDAATGAIDSAKAKGKQAVESAKGVRKSTTHALKGGSL